MTRLWPEGEMIEVMSDKDQVPQRLIWQGKTHTVSHITRRWRIRSDWWDEPLWRDYFKLTTESGLLLIIFQDLINGQWYLQRLYD
jgi:hypothetical protein